MSIPAGDQRLFPRRLQEILDHPQATKFFIENKVFGITGISALQAFFFVV
jgi:hypothetical protein